MIIVKDKDGKMFLFEAVCLYVFERDTERQGEKERAIRQRFAIGKSNMDMHIDVIVHRPSAISDRVFVREQSLHFDQINEQKNGQATFQDNRFE
jgi:hypothetical protein